MTAGFLFDVPVRFDTDYLEVDLSAFAAGAIPKIPLVEIRAGRANHSLRALQAKLDCAASPRSCALLAASRRNDGVGAGLHRSRRGLSSLLGIGVHLPRRQRALPARRRRAQLGLGRSTARNVRRAVRRHAQRGRSRRRPLRRGRRRALPGRLERAGAARAAGQRLARRGQARGRGLHRRIARLGQQLAEEAGRLLYRDLLGRSRRCALHRRSRPIRPFAAAARSPRSAATSAFTASGLDAFADGWFTAGKLTFTGGANAGLGDRGEEPSQRAAARSRFDALAGDAAADSRRRHLHASRPAATSASPPAATASTTPSTSAAFRTSPATISSSAIRCRASRAMTARVVAVSADNDAHPRSHRRRSARLDRHAVSASGFAQGRRLRLPRPGARRLARGDRRRAGSARRLMRPTGRKRAASETLAQAAARHLIAIERDAISPRRRAAVPLARRHSRPSTRPSSPRRTDGARP